MKEYINGCYTMYGTRALNIFEIFHKEKINDVYSYALGYIDSEEDGISIDIYEGNEVICWEHTIRTNYDIKDLKNIKDFSVFTQLATNRLREMRLI